LKQAKLTASRGGQLSMFLSCADNFREDLTFRGLEEHTLSIVFDIFTSRGKHLNVCGCCMLDELTSQ
jgi:hypothetical protein